MALPPLTPEERQRALDKAAEARKVRAEVKDRLKRGVTTMQAVLEEADAEPRDYQMISKMKVVNLLESMPGIGKVRAKQIMERLQIADNRRIRSLGTNQRAGLEREFADPVAA